MSMYTLAVRQPLSLAFEFAIQGKAGKEIHLLLFTFKATHYYF